MKIGFNVRYYEERQGIERISEVLPLDTENLPSVIGDLTAGLEIINIHEIREEIENPGHKAHSAFLHIVNILTIDHPGECSIELQTMKDDIYFEIEDRFEGNLAITLTKQDVANLYNFLGSWLKSAFS